MEINKKIKMCLVYIGKSEAWLAREIGTTPSAFNQRLKNGKFSTAELKKIAETLGAKFEMNFIFPDGTKI